ncbi:MAG: polyprenyl synthetase family protein [Spirochaeta sp.]|jgi:geranylgeranyl diphosphate synthase type I|nr:polyprenyl synthetase family protein [Spirochaeta sp.]
MMHQRLITARTQIETALTTIFDRRDSPFRDIDLWSNDVVRRLRKYALNGKLLRGALVPFSYWLFRQNEEESPAAIDAGVAMELIQSFLLIHDDIMDQDDMRRGQPAIHAQYRDSTPGTNPCDADRAQYGISLGTCVGDISAFFAVNVLSSIAVEPELKNRIIEQTSREIMLVGLAQMQDVHHGYVDHAPEDDVLNVYTYKTGRYTFSLPMRIGALLAGAGPEQQSALTTLGEQLGRIFQIRDDRLGILEDAEVTGKPTGSDIRENKKTLYRALLFDRTDSDDPVRSLFGKDELSPRELEAVRSALASHGVLADVDARVNREAQAAKTLIENLNLTANGRDALLSLLQFNVDRTV